jgi:hypothetical protein
MPHDRVCFFCREARAGKVPEARLAAANAAVMSEAARSFIRADSADPHAGWAGSSSSSKERMAALLCFDEMQVSYKLHSYMYDLHLLRDGSARSCLFA